MDTPSLTDHTRARASAGRPVYLAILAALALVVGVILPTTPLSGSSAAGAETMQTTLSASEATFTTSRKPSTVLGQLPYVSATSSQDRTYIKFDGSSLEGKKIISAELVLHVATTEATEPGVLVYSAPTTWTEDALTRSNQPADSDTRLNTVAPQAIAGEAVTVPLQNLSAVSTSGPFAFRVQYSQSSVGTTFVGTGSRAPKLVVSVEDGEPAVVPSTPAQPVAPPAVSSPSDKKVFAHYFPPYPLSLDNKPADSDYYTRNYLPVDGEGGIHAGYGGLLRDRPLPVGHSSSESWQVDNLRTEIRQAKTAGIDGFLVDIMSVSGMNWTTTKNLFSAAEKENFKITPMIDGTASISRLTPTEVAAALAPLFNSPAAFTEGADHLLSSFKAEEPGSSWFQQIVSQLENRHGVPITFQAVFLNPSDANMQAFAPFTDSFGNWGARNPRVIDKLPDYDAQAAKYGKDWMEPVAPQDMRPRLGVFAEADNTEALRAGWAKAIRDDADYVQMVTWNDYSESTQFAPSIAHGSAYLEISRYYADWFHTGSAPKISEDELFLTHRTQFADASTTVKHKPILPSLSGSQNDVRDTAEALVFLTAPATVELTVGGTTSRFDAPAGVSAFTVPLKLGSVQAKIVRGGAAVKTADSPHRVLGTPKVQDLQYYAVTGE